MKIVSRIALGAAALLLATQAMAQTWPTKAVTLMVPWPAGGPSDFVARQIQPGVQRALGQPLVIENLGGVGGALGVQKMLSATDGHAALLGSPLELIIPPLTLASVKYKPTDLRLVAQMVKAPLVLLARKDLPANTIDELLALAAQQKDKPLSIAHTGSGSMFHLVGEKFAQMTGVPLVQVPYKGAAPALSDLMGGQVDLMFTVFGGSVPASVNTGKFKAIGLASSQPRPSFPQVGTLATHRLLKGFEFDSWAAVLMPRGTPDAVAKRMNQAVYDAVQIPQTRQALEATGNLLVAPTSLEELEHVYQSEIQRYQGIAKSINLQPQQQ